MAADIEDTNVEFSVSPLNTLPNAAIELQSGTPVSSISFGLAQHQTLFDMGLQENFEIQENFDVATLSSAITLSKTILTQFPGSLSQSN